MGKITLEDDFLTMFQQVCLSCKETWNAAFGIVGTTQIVAPPLECPHCGSTDITKLADGWLLENGERFPAQHIGGLTVLMAFCSRKQVLLTLIAPWLDSAQF